MNFQNICTFTYQKTFHTLFHFFLNCQKLKPSNDEILKMSQNPTTYHSELPKKLVTF